jgi:hypothetical protein
MINLFTLKSIVCTKGLTFEEMKNVLLFSLCLFSFGFVSCLKSDKPITLPAKGDGKLIQVDMGEKYQYQYFVSLSEGKVVHRSENNGWHIAFQNNANQFGVAINEANGMRAASTNKLNFADVTNEDTLRTNLVWKTDTRQGVMDSSAIGNWKINKHVYIIKLNREGTQMRKLQIISENPVEYVVKVGMLNDPIGISLNIVKNKNQNQSYFSFFSNNVIEGIEPDNKASWDLQFCLFNHTFYDQNPALPYTVNGVLLNQYNTVAFRDSTKNYLDINFDYAKNLNFGNNLETIGYDWKIYDRDKSIYIANKNYSHIVKNQFGYLFKIRFLDFYSATGVKGSPKFEFQALN